MADLSRHDRGQLVLVTAVSIAALLVLVAVLLSSVVYTENVATRDATAGDARAAQLYRVAAVEAVDGIADRTNRAGGSYAEFRANVTTWSDLQARHAATGGASPRVSVRSTTNGTRIYQMDANRTLTNASGNGSWQLAAGATVIEDWRLTLNQSSLVAPGPVSNVSDLEASGAYHVNLTEGPTTWRAFVYASGGDVAVHVDANGTLASPCSATPAANGTVTVDISGRTVGGAPCAALAFEDTVDAPLDVAYSDGANATGTYSLVVDQPIGSVTDSDISTGTGSPSTAHHVSDVYLDVTYTTDDLEYVARNVSVDAEVDS